MKKLFPLSVLFLTVCGLSSELLYTDRNGNNVYQATCNGVVRTIGDCYKLAAQQCAGDFDIVTQDQFSAGSFGTFDGNQSSSMENPFSTYSRLNSDLSGSMMTTNNIKRHIIFKCKKF